MELITRGRRAALRPLVGTLAAALVVTLTAAGCGGGESSHASTGASESPPASTSTPGSSPLTLDADPSGQLKFTKQQLTADAGAVTLKMGNPSPLEHNIAIKGNGVEVAGKVVGRGGTSTVEADLKPGTYTFSCTVPGHAAAGMTGTLRVR